MLTTHISKRLEFPVVLIPGVGFMLNRSQVAERIPKVIAVEERLLYITMTRATEYLKLILRSGFSVCDKIGKGDFFEALNLTIMNHRNNSEISVSALTQKITKLLREGVGEVRVIGEISGYKATTSGHRYFTLKDVESQIDCVLWSSKLISFMPSDGMRVILKKQYTASGIKNL